MIDLSSPNSIRTVATIISQLECKLYDLNVKIDNDERNNYAEETETPLDEVSIIFGSDYRKLENTIKHTSNIEELMASFRTFLNDRNVSISENDYDDIKSKIENIINHA